MHEWLEVDPKDLTDDELVERLHEVETLRARLDAAQLETLREWDVRMVWAADGARSGGGWLKGHTGMAGSTARERVRVARALASAPLTAAAFKRGELTYGKVRALVGVRTDRTAERFAIDEEMLVGFARTFGTDELERLLAHWVSCVDADGASADAAARWTRRGASLSDVQGTGHLKAQFDPESLAIFRAELDALMYDAAKTDRQDAKSDASAAPRTAQQRRLDCLVEMARRSAACNTETAARKHPEVVVMVDYENYLNGTGTAELDGGGRVSGEAVHRLACEAGIVRAVVAGQSEVLDLGRATPVPNAAQRRAAALKWSSCVWPGCDVPFSWTTLHHIVPYRRGAPTGGPTNNDDLAPVCDCHHGKVHEGGFLVTRDADTLDIQIRRPDGTLIAVVSPDGPMTRRRALLPV